MWRSDSEMKDFQPQTPRRVFACSCGFSLLQVAYGSQEYVCEHCGRREVIFNLTRSVEKQAEES